MINILYTINYLTNGGPTRVLENIVNKLDKKKYKVTIMTIINQNNQRIVEYLRENNINVVELNYPKNMITVLKKKVEIIQKIKEISPQIIHTHGIVSTLIVSSKKVNGTKITTIHNNIFEDYEFTYGKIKGRIFAFLHIFCLRKFQETICCSKTSYDILKNRLSNVSFIRNGVDVTSTGNMLDTRRKIREKLNINDNNVVYIYGGVINERKRVVELVRMFSKSLNENETLLIVGDGPKKEMAQREAMDKVIFTGFQDNIIEYFQAADIYVSNSASEGFSISIIEALHCELLCMLSDISSHQECFGIDKKYYIGEYFNKDNFMEKKVIISDKIKTIDRKKLREFQEKYLSAKVMSQQYEKCYLKYIG